MSTYTPTGASQPIQLDENNNFIDPVTGELMHQLTVEEMPRHTFGAELYAPDAVRPTAHWIKCDLVEVEHGECTRYKDAGIECSKCNHIYDKFALWDGIFCPGCGSRMIDYEDGERR